MLWTCFTQYASKFGKLSSGHWTGKGQFSFQSQRKAMPKNAQTTAQLHSSHTLVKLKILQARLQQYMNCELPDVQTGFRKGGGTRDQIANICWIIKKAREFQISIYFCFIDYAKSFDCVDHNKLWKILKEMGISDHLTCGHVWMWELDYKESWAPKNWCFWTVVLEKTPESPLDSKEIQPVHPKGDQSWVFIGRTDVEAETPILWPLDVKSWLIWKDPDAGKDWRQEEKGMTEDKVVGWHHRLNGHGFGWTRELVTDREAWHAAVHGIEKSQIWLSDWTDWCQKCKQILQVH